MKRWILLLGLAVAVAWMLIRFLRPDIEASERGGGARSTLEESKTFASEELKASTGQRRGGSGEPLPPVDTPLRLIVDALRSRADRGDAKAACRLAAEWTHCLRLHNRSDGRESSLRSLERSALLYASGKKPRQAGMSLEAFEKRIDFARDKLERTKRLLLHCEGVPTPRPEEVTRYWRRAALAGHLPSMRNYAVGNAFRRNDVLNNLPALTVYRREAVGIAKQAIGRGDLRTAIALAGAYSPLSTRNSTFLSQLVEPDAGKTLTLLYRIREASERAGPFPVNENVRRELADSIEELEATTSAQTVREAAGRARSAQPLSLGSRGFGGIYMTRQGYVGDLPREECDGPSNLGGRLDGTMP